MPLFEMWQLILWLVCAIKVIKKNNMTENINYLFSRMLKIKTWMFTQFSVQSKIFEKKTKLKKKNRGIKHVLSQEYKAELKKKKKHV